MWEPAGSKSSRISQTDFQPIEAHVEESAINYWFLHHENGYSTRPGDSLGITRKGHTMSHFVWRNPTSNEELDSPMTAILNCLRAGYIDSVVLITQRKEGTFHAKVSVEWDRQGGDLKISGIERFGASGHLQWASVIDEFLTTEEADESHFDVDELTKRLEMLKTEREKHEG